MLNHINSNKQCSVLKHGGPTIKKKLASKLNTEVYQFLGLPLFLILMLSRRCNMIQAIICAMCVALGQLIMTSLAKNSHSSADSFYHENLEKLDTDVYFTNSLNHWPHRHCEKKTSIKHTREQSVTMTSQLLAAGSSIDDVTIGIHLFNDSLHASSILNHTLHLTSLVLLIPVRTLAWRKLLMDGFSAQMSSNAQLLLGDMRHWLQVSHIDPALTPSQWSSSGNPVCLELRLQCTLECHWRNNCWQQVCFQCASSGLPVAFQWSSSVFQLCKLTLDRHWDTTGW